MPHMTGTTKITYKAQLETQRIRDELELGVDTSDPFEKAFEQMTDVEKIVFVLLEYQFTPRWIIEHMEFSRQRYYQVRENIAKKVLEFMEDGDEV